MFFLLVHEIVGQTGISSSAHSKDQVMWTLGGSVLQAGTIIIEEEPVKEDPTTLPMDFLSQIQIYPNPFRAFVNIRSVNPLAEIEFTVLDLNGTEISFNSDQLERSEYLVRLDFSHVAIGTYILMMRKGNMVLSRYRIIKWMDQ